MKFSLSRSSLSLAIAISAVSASAVALWPRAEPPAFFFQIRMRASLPGFARLYYGIGSAAKEADSTRLPVIGGNRDVDYKFPLPEGRHLNLRFDPTDRAGSTMVLTGACVIDRTGNLFRTIPPQQIKALSQIEQLHADETEVTLTTAALAEHPALTVQLGPALVLRNYARPSARTLARRFGIAFVPSTVLSLLLISALAVKRKSATFPQSRKLATWLQAHPKKLLFAVAAASVILSCYPIVFFGKSFLSPNNHSHTCLLYAEMPTVPGYNEVAIDQEKGSDLGAAIWYSWPASVVESRAIFKYFELPLWNRYDSCGLPLLGQGQSMFGDPLHLLALLTNGSPVWWDLKYLLAKLLFAGCVGLCALQLTKHLPAAAVITASAPFISFFSYRYSHPAFFSMCYAPVILLCWLNVMEARKGRPTMVWLGMMVLANWALMNSGTVKEAYILLLFMNLCGFLTLVLTKSVTGKATKVRQALCAQILFLLIATPIWLTFLNALRTSWTPYNTGAVFQLEPGRLLGLFDDIFYRQFNTNELRLYPSANFLVLLGVLWCCFTWRRIGSNTVAWGISITSLLALAFVFGGVPASLILRLPFLRQVYHIANTFSCVAIVCLLMLAAFGVKAFWSDCQSGEFKRTYISVLFCLAALLAFYLGTAGAAPFPSSGGHVAGSGFFWGYAALVLLATALAPWIGRAAIKNNFAQARHIFGLGLIFVLLHWRHGMHLVTPFDSYVMNPHQRTNLVAASSPTLGLMRSHAEEPFRSVGFSNNLFPGYGSAIEVEQIDSADPLSNKYYRNLLDASGVRLVFGSAHEGRIGQDLASDLPLFDMLNVRFFVGYAEGKDEIVPSLKKIGSLDLDVYESSKVWPRAFFSGQFLTYDSEKDFIRLLKEGDGRPFAAIQQTALGEPPELKTLSSISSTTAARQIVPATGYMLTNNRTSFHIAAPGQGIVVLTEPYVEGDFQLRVNGKPANYFRVNAAFRGVFLPEAGDYHFSFAYWPRHLTISLWISAFAMILLLWWVVSGFKHRET